MLKSTKGEQSVAWLGGQMVTFKVTFDVMFAWFDGVWGALGVLQHVSPSLSYSIFLF